MSIAMSLFVIPRGKLDTARLSVRRKALLLAFPEMNLCSIHSHP